MKVVETVKDLGVMMKADPRFDSQVTNIISKTTIKIHESWILRCLALTRPQHYDKLFRSLILPIRLSAGGLRHPQFVKDMNRQQRIVDSFYSRVEWRCRLQYR
jgi:hypothetical protein